MKLSNHHVAMVVANANRNKEEQSGMMEVIQELEYQITKKMEDLERRIGARLKDILNSSDRTCHQANPRTKVRRPVCFKCNLPGHYLSV